jgi:hypothetical protein
MLSEDEIYLFAASRGVLATVDWLHAGEGLRGVFFTQGASTCLLGPLSAVQQMTAEQFLTCLE